MFGLILAVGALGVGIFIGIFVGLAIGQARTNRAAQIEAQNQPRCADPRCAHPRQSHLPGGPCANYTTHGGSCHCKKYIDPFAVDTITNEPLTV